MKLHRILFVTLYMFSSIAHASEDISIRGCMLSGPIIRICASSNVKHSRVKKSIEYWKNLGYIFGDIILNDTSKSCTGTPEFGEIVIKVPDSNFNYRGAADLPVGQVGYLAITTRTVLVDSNILLYSIIYVRNSEVNKERVLEHEIGHALGWNHSKDKYHIMYEEWMLGGLSSYGISAKAYARKCDNIIP